MGFQKMNKSQLPPRMWALVGYPGAGKSTFSTQMRGPLVVVDADQRYAEVAHLVHEDIYPVSSVAYEHTDPHTIAKRLNENMPDALATPARVGTIVIDSLTAIIAPRVVNAMVSKAEGETENLSAAFRDKALAMRELQDAVTKWGVDTLYLYHLHDARDAKGKEHTRATVSALELVRLTRSINMQLEIAQENGRRGVKIVWARRGRQNVMLWDESGIWRGMPERIERAAYEGLTQQDMDRIENSTPEFFPSPEVAIAWAIEQGAFESDVHARNAYEKVKREAEPKSAREMAAAWVLDVQRRLAESAASTKEQNGVPEAIDAR